MNRLFADTFYFLALLNKNDEAHARAVASSATVDRLITTEWVLLELADALASSRRRNMFVETRRELVADANAKIVPLSMDVHEQGIRLYASRPDKNGRSRIASHSL